MKHPLSHNRPADLMKRFGLDPNRLYWSGTHERAAMRLLDAVQNNRMVAIVGDFGSGKSTLARMTLQDSGVELVRINNPNREGMRINHVTRLMIEQLSTESAQRYTLAQSTQLERILGELVVVQGRQVTVLIENAHRLKPQLLMGLKDMRESLEFNSRNMLFSIVLIGQGDLRKLVNIHGEVRLRTKVIELSEKAGYMTHQERTQYLLHVYQHVITQEAAKRLAMIETTPLALDAAMENLLGQLSEMGGSQIDLDLLPISVREIRDAAGVSVRELARALDMPPSTLQDKLTQDDFDCDFKTQALQAIDALRERKRAS